MPYWEKALLELDLADFKEVVFVIYDRVGDSPLIVKEYTAVMNKKLGRIGKSPVFNNSESLFEDEYDILFNSFFEWEDVRNQADLEREGIDFGIHVFSAVIPLAIKEAAVSDFINILIGYSNDQDRCARESCCLFKNKIDLDFMMFNYGMEEEYIVCLLRRSDKNAPMLDCIKKNFHIAYDNVGG